MTKLRIQAGQEEKLLELFHNGHEFKGYPCGWLVGVVDGANDEGRVVSVLSSLRSTSFRGGSLNYTAEAEDLLALLPHGLQIVGAVEILQGGKITTNSPVAVASLHKTLRAQNNNNGSVLPKQWNGCIIARIAAGASELQVQWYISDTTEQNAEGSEIRVPEICEQGLWDRHVLLRAEIGMDIPLCVPNPEGKDYVGSKFGEAIAAAISDICSGQAVFLADFTAVVNTKGGGEVVLVDTTGAVTSKEEGGEDDEEEGTIAARKSANLSASSSSSIADLLGKGGQPRIIRTATNAEVQVPVKMTLCLRSRQPRPTDGCHVAAAVPVVDYKPSRRASSLRHLCLGVDVLCVCPVDMRLCNAAVGLVVPAIVCQLAAMQRLVMSDATANDRLSAFHFLPLGFPHPVTAVYSLSRGEAEVGAIAARTALHHRLGLPPDRPMLRAANALSFDDVTPAHKRDGKAPSSSLRLRDVHAGLAPSGVSGATASLVQGSYEYFHYMQDRIDDGGWGCAYRSLQTIVSWFVLQHYTTVAVPSHRSIQETLVAIGDKDPSFVGSSQWIGAIELSYVLDQLLGVTCKILTIQSGADMPSKGRELARHFQTQGTPVMIGGGVLAYTLLGVDFNELTGECAFLILDPHYTGPEDLKTIRNGGWCSWKHAITETGKPFFVRDAFYNLLLPQRPVTV